MYRLFIVVILLGVFCFFYYDYYVSKTIKDILIFFKNISLSDRYGPNYTALNCVGNYSYSIFDKKFYRDITLERNKNNETINIIYEPSKLTDFEKLVIGRTEPMCIYDIFFVYNLYKCYLLKKHIYDNKLEYFNEIESDNKIEIEKKLKKTLHNTIIK